MFDDVDYHQQDGVIFFSVQRLQDQMSTRDNLRCSGREEGSSYFFSVWKDTIHNFGNQLNIPKDLPLCSIESQCVIEERE
jgi:hypothetical protein